VHLHALVHETCYFNVLTSRFDFEHCEATKRERLLTTARANQTTGLTNGRAANWVPVVEFSPFRALTRRQMTFPSGC